VIICCGEALIDMIRSPVQGGGEGFLPLPGGSTYNTAIAIGKLGVPVKFLGRFSTDMFGEMLTKRLKESHVGEDLIIRSKQNTSLAFVKQIKGKEAQYVFYTEGTAGPSFSAADLPLKLPAETRCIIFGSISMTLEPMASAIEALILREGTRKSADQMDGAPVISFDPNIRPYMIKDRNSYIERFEKWVAASTIAKISSEDFAYIYPKLESSHALSKILSMGPRLAICTMGPKGALGLLRRNDGSLIRVTVPAINLPVADTIGAGDTFHGALLAWLELKGKMSRSALVNLCENELYKALLFASKAAAIVCTRQGAVPPSRREIESLKIPELKAAPAKAAPKKPAAKAKTMPKKTVPKKPVAKTITKKTAPKKATPKKPVIKKAAPKTGTSKKAGPKAPAAKKKAKK